MISKRWLVQSSAVGVFGAAVFSLPFWIGSGEGPEHEEAPMSCCEPATAIGEKSSQQADEAPAEAAATVRAPKATEVGQRAGEGVEETTRTIRVRYHIEGAYQGPVCPAELEPRPPAVLQRGPTPLTQ